jgi:beta-galactosidase
VVAPALNVLTPEAAKNLEDYVRGGGHLVLGQRSGMKDEDNGLAPQRQPGLLANLLGARVEQFYALDKPVPIEGDWGTGVCKAWAEQLGVTSPETKVLMRYGKSNGWLDAQPAAVTRKVGSGSITYIGAALDESAMKAAVKWMLSDAGMTPVMENLPTDVDVAIRSGNGKRVLIFTNYASEPRTIAMPHEMTDVLNGQKVNSVTLPEYGVRVLR